MAIGKKILITGATGFIGANLVRAFMKEGAEIHILTRESSNRWRISDILCNLKEYCVDLANYGTLEKTISDIRPDIIFHNAVYGGFTYQDDFDRIFATNLFGTVNLIRACMKIDFELFVNAGSSSEYGIKRGPIKEVDIPEPVSDYGVCKALSTIYCQIQSRSKNLPVVSFRFFSPYGYYEEKRRLIPSVILSCLKNKPPLLSSPKPVRDFIFIDDIVRIYEKAIENRDKIGGEIFNVGCGMHYSVEDVVNKIVYLTGNKVKPAWNSLPNPRIEPEIWMADISKAEDMLKWHPQCSLENGLHKTLIWFKENSSIYEDRIAGGNVL